MKKLNNKNEYIQAIKDLCVILLYFMGFFIIPFSLLYIGSLWILSWIISMEIESGKILVGFFMVIVFVILPVLFVRDVCNNNGY